MSSILPSLIRTEERYNDQRKSDFSAERLEELRLAVAAGDAPGNQYDWVAWEPGVMYPAALAEIVERIQRDDVPNPHNALYPYYTQALRLGVETLQRWMEPVDDINQLTPAERSERAGVLELARLWATEVVHQAAGKPLGIRSMPDDTWRL